MKFVLITYVSVGTKKEPHWAVYGHNKEHVNKSLGHYDSEYKAIKKAHNHGLPVMRGHANSYNIAAHLRVLSKAKY